MVLTRMWRQAPGQWAHLLPPHHADDSPATRRTTEMRRILCLTLLALIAACSEAEQGDRTPSDAGRPDPDDSISAALGDTSPAAPAADPVERWTARLPEGALRRDRACPFECCVYRRWTADSRITLLDRPDADASSTGELVTGTSFDADSGFVRITGVALVAVTDTVTPMVDRSLARGDTLVLLDYVGEGFHNVWLEGEVTEVADFWSSATGNPRGEVIGEPASEWWVHATGPSGSGWFRADAPGVQLSGVDACG